MNKIKVIYDAVRKMKNKDSIKGTLKVEALRDQDKIFENSYSFERNGQGCKVKGKTMLEADCDGKKIKLENTIDLLKEGRCEHQHFHHHMAHDCCMKGGPGSITTVLGILSSIRLEEKEDGSAVLSLEAADMPEDLKADICEAMKQCHTHRAAVEGSKEQHMCMKELHGMEVTDFALKVVINKSSGIEKVTIDLKGEKKHGEAGKQQMKLAAELCLE